MPPNPEDQLSLELIPDPSCYNPSGPAMAPYPRTADPQTAKALGAFYTDAEIAEFLAAWAIRSKNDRVIDPSFGGGVFLRAAAKRFGAIGGDPKRLVFGVEIAPKVHGRIVPMLHDEFGIVEDNLIRSDFFDLDRASLPQFDAVIGNPPFIRYQRFAGKQRHTALRRARELGVELSQLSSSWAPFVVLSVSLLREGGRLAMVVPMELTYATYARPLIGFLQKSFQRISILSFQKRLFPEISEDTVLLLCEGKGLPFERAIHHDLANAGSLRSFDSERGSVISNRSEGVSYRLALNFLPRKTRQLYQQFRENLKFKLGHYCNIGIGYVTGSNDFFHLSKSRAEHWKIPGEYLRPAVFNSRAFNGVSFSHVDLAEAMKSDKAGYLLHLERKPNDSAVNAYLRHGEQEGVPAAYKCRSRNPWFRVPHVYEPNCFLTYMSGFAPRLIANFAGAVASNNLHVLRFKNGHVAATDLSAAWLTSLTQLSAEIEGHALGGGMLKIEPREAANVILPLNGKPKLSPTQQKTIDGLVRNGKIEEAQAVVDDIFLVQGLGLSKSACSDLRSATRELRNRRMHDFR